MLSNAMRDAVTSKEAVSKAKGIRTPAEDKAADINTARKAGKITDSDMTQMINDAYKVSDEAGGEHPGFAD